MSEAAVQKEQAVSDTQDAASKRERSSIEFPYGDLEGAIEVAKAVHTVGGMSCKWEQLAAQLNQAATGGGFRTRVAAAKTFGFLSYSQGTVTLANLGARVTDPAQEAAAKVEAFLHVPLYKTVYDKFKGLPLPQGTALEREMVGMGVSQKQSDKARQAFQRSAQSAGFFAFGTTKLVLPSIKSSHVDTTPPPPPPAEEDEKLRRGGGNGGGNGSGLHPFVQGLLETLPPTTTAAKAEWSLQERTDWLQTAAGIFNLIYKAADGDAGAVSVSVDRPKA
jgi:hypothetical protein